MDFSELLSVPDILKYKRALCVQPHPDDNEIGMGGTVAALMSVGCEVHYLTVTNGDKGNRDKTASPEQTARQRRAEAMAAGRHLGVSEFHFLDYGDGTLSDVVGIASDIKRVLQEVQPDVMFCPDPWLPYEGHYDHIITGQAASSAFQSGICQAIGYYFTANPNAVIDISDTFERKFEAIALHDSQMDEASLALFRYYFHMKAQELAHERGFALGEGFKILRPLHTHCFVDALRI